MKSVLKIIFATAIAAMLLTGCSKDNNPLQPDTGGTPDPEPIVINTPSKMHITVIKVARFPEKKSNSDFWDYNPVLPLSSRPDVFVELSHGGTTVYRSNTEQDAYYLATYAFTKAALLSGSALPYNASVTTKYKLEVMDDDTIVNDNMATLTFSPLSYYNNDNAKTFSINKTIGGVGIIISGTWIY
jgi:hypothetical protein